MNKYQQDLVLSTISTLTDMISNTRVAHDRDIDGLRSDLKDLRKERDQLIESRAALLEQLEQLEGQLALSQEKLDRSRAASTPEPPVQPVATDPIPGEWTDRDVFRHCQIVVVRNESYDGASEHICKYSKFVGRDGDLLRHEVVFRARLTTFRYCRLATPEEVEQFKRKTEQFKKEVEARLAVSVLEPIQLNVAAPKTPDGMSSNDEFRPGHIVAVTNDVEGPYTLAEYVEYRPESVYVHGVLTKDHNGDYCAGAFKFCRHATPDEIEEFETEPEDD